MSDQPIWRTVPVRPKTETCEKCGKRAFVCHVQLGLDVAESGSILVVWTTYFCDRTGLCAAQAAWVRYEILELNQDDGETEDN